MRKLADRIAGVAADPGIFDNSAAWEHWPGCHNASFLGQPFCTAECSGCWLRGETFHTYYILKLAGPIPAPGYGVDLEEMFRLVPSLLDTDFPSEDAVVDAVGEISVFLSKIFGYFDTPRASSFSVVTASRGAEWWVGMCFTDATFKSRVASFDTGYVERFRRGAWVFDQPLGAEDSVRN